MACLVVLIFIGLDFLTGTIKAIKNNELSSKKLRDGIFKKIALVIVLALGYLLDYGAHYIGMDIPVNVVVLISAYIGYMEAVSMIENLAEINPEIVPEKLKELIGVDKNAVDK